MASDNASVICQAPRGRNSTEPGVKVYSVAFSGSLSEMSIIESIQLLHMNKRSGHLDLGVGFIVFKDGEFIKAKLASYDNEYAINKIIQ